MHIDTIIKIISKLILTIIVNSKHGQYLTIDIENNHKENYDNTDYDSNNAFAYSYPLKYPTQDRESNRTEK